MNPQKTISKIITGATLPILTMILLVGCAGLGTTTGKPTLSADLLGTTVVQTLPSITPPATESSPTPTTTSTPEPGIVRLNFASRATVGFEEGQIQPGQALKFVVGAEKGQPMIAMADSPSHKVTLAIAGKDGTDLVEASQKLTTWEGLLYATQDYYIQVLGGTAAETFTLTVIIPSRISFAPDAISATVNGSTPGGTISSYVLQASAGQTMTVSLDAPANTASLSIYGFTDGQTLVRSATGSTYWTGILPSSQDYIIDVVPNSEDMVDFKLTVEVK
jgi:hypothetical protein